MENQSVSKTRYYRTSTFQIGQFARAVEGILAEYDQTNNAFMNMGRNLPDGTYVFDESLSVSHLEQICVLNDQQIHIHVNGPQLNEIAIMGGSEYFSIDVDATDSRVLFHVFDHFTKALQLAEVESPSDRAARLAQAYPPEKTIRGMLKRIEKLESAVFDPGKRLQCFLSYRFGTENDAVAHQVRKFLELLDIEVTTGEAYEPRKVSDKIVSKLQKDLDLIILLVTSGGESMWTRDEIVTARDRGAHVVPVVENGAKFVAGIFGDHEWIPYETGHISDAFMKILEAVHYVRRKKVEDAISRLS